MLPFWTKGKKYRRIRIVGKNLLSGESLRGNYCRIRVAAILIASRSECIVLIRLDNLNTLTPWD